MEEHDVQHQRGETALKPREWFEEKRIEYVHRWCWEALKDELCYASWGYVPPDHLLAWAEKHDLVKYLPGCYRGDSNG
jgi:hypothetical protein